MTAKVKKILLIEDEQTLLKILDFQIRKWGYDIRIAIDPSEAELILESEPVDLIILDIILPQMDGVDFLRKVRSSKKQYQNIPVIVFSNLDPSYKEDEFQSLNISNYIVKERAMGTDVLKNAISAVLT
ncbi:MAG: Response regulator DrrA [Parcubacteria group bacterium GW2011_GWA2_44_12]|nr:MAG: Response regulator DrrA [Parcubacteria group bacterium GW2011_GWA2_44_12]